MTESLQQAIAAVSRLPDAEQDAIAAWLIGELESERKWDSMFDQSQDVLSKLARDASSEHAAGETRDWDIH